MAKFRLAPVLKLRLHREELRKRELAVALADENRLKEVVLRLARLRQDQADEFRRQQQAGQLDVRAIIERKTFIGLLERRIREQLVVVARAEQQTQQRRQELLAAMKDRKALDVLHERHNERVRQAEARQETMALDEIGGRLGGAGVEA